MYEAARETDQIKHSGAAVGTGIGTALEVAAGVAALVPGPGDVVAVVLAVLGIAAFAAPLLGGLIHYNAGPIKTGAKRVFIGGKAAARAEIDVVGCDAPKVIAQGSKTVAIEDYPAARIDDQTQCGGSIGEGFPTVFIGREPATYVHIDSEVPLWLQIAYVVASFSVLAGGGIKALLGAGEQEAFAPISKFSDYIFKDGADHGKDVVFEGLGYGKEHSAQLAEMWEQQAATKFANGEYTLGKLDQYGQRVNIEIEVPGIGDAAGKTSYMRSGWMIKPDGSITLNTAFSGFTR